MSDRPQNEIPYLHVRPPRRIVGVGGEGEPLSEIAGNRAGLLRLREQIDHALGLEETASLGLGYREIDGARFDVTVRKATRPEQMGEAREPDVPDYSRFT